jgi:hypothetical protein
MMGFWVFRLVDDRGVFTIAGSSIRDPICCSSTVVNRAAVTVVLSSYVRTIGVGVMTRLPGRLVHQGAFVSIGTIKVKRMGLFGLWRLNMANLRR